MEARTLLAEIYEALAEAWVAPGDGGGGPPREEAVAKAATELLPVDSEASALLLRFLESPVDEEQYINLFELNPRCPLYLGSHSYEEPQGCAGAGVSDRNAYMLELLAIYRHFGFVPNGTEMADYLPMMVEMLALTAESKDPLRDKYVNQYLLPLLPPLRAKLAELGTPYASLLEATERVLRLDLGGRLQPEPRPPRPQRASLPVLESHHG